MRLKEFERKAILGAIRQRDAAARVYLFGSRVDDRKRGGDIDLLVVSHRIDFREQLAIRRDILDAIGWQKLDLIFEDSEGSEKPISEIARSTGVEL